MQLHTIAEKVLDLTYAEIPSTSAGIKDENLIFGIAVDIIFPEVKFIIRTK